MKNRSTRAFVACIGVCISTVSLAKQPSEKPSSAAAQPAASDKPSAASEFDLSWQRDIPDNALLNAVGYYYGMLAQLVRIQSELPGFAEKCKEASERLRTRLNPGVEAIKDELRRRDPEVYEITWRGLDADIKRQIETIEVKESEVIGALESKRWESTTLPANVIAPILSYTPKYLEHPELLWSDEYTTSLCQPIPNTADLRLCTTIPRSWSLNKNRTPIGMLWALFSNLSRGAASMWVSVTPLQAGAGDNWTPEKILKTLEETPPAEPAKVLSREVVSIGGRRIVAVTCESRSSDKDDAIDQYFQSCSWVEQDLIIEFTFAVSKGRKVSEPAIESSRLKSVFDAHRELFNKVLGSVKLDESKPAAPAEKPSEPKKP